MRLRARLRNCDHVWLAQQPGKRNLSGSRIMGLRDFLQRCVSEQLTALTDRRIRHDRDLVRLAPRQKIELDFTILQIVTEPDLLRICDRVPATRGPPYRRRRSLRRPSVLSFRKRAALERVDSFLERRRSLSPVQKA